MKSILITGARSGIIAPVIKKLLNKNYKLYLTVHTNKELEKIKEKYNKYKNVECFKLDVLNKEDKNKLKTLDIDILISNAAISYGGSISELPIEKLRENFEVNVFSNFEIVQIVLKNMIKKDKGKIIMISSLSGLVPLKFIGGYSATKASIIKLTETLKSEIKLISKNIKIVLVEPGMYHTGFNQYMLENKYDWMNKKSYFKEELEYIRKQENLLFKIFELKKFDSIANPIYKAVVCKNPPFLVRAPLYQVIGAKIYLLFKA